MDIGGVLGLASDGTNIYAVDNLARVMKLTSALVETWWVAGSSHTTSREQCNYAPALTTNIILYSYLIRSQVL